MQQFLVYYPDVCLQLNMFRAFSRPSSEAQWLQWQPLVLPSYRGDSRAVFVVGPAGRPEHVQCCRVQMILCAILLCSIAHSIICTRLFRGKMHSDWFNRIEILQGRWQHGEKVGYSYLSGIEKTLFKWDLYVPLITKGLKDSSYALCDLSF